METTEKKDTLLKKVIGLLFGDVTVIYTVLIIMAIMYHYRDSLVYAYGAVAWIVTILLYRLFSFIEKHKLLGPAVYIAAAFAVIQAAGCCMRLGNEEYPIPFGIWFLTPQDALDYNRWYTLAIFLLFTFFMVSVIYYFMKIRYRIFMNFLIFIIPFAIYGKEYEKMPTVFIMFLTVGYIITMFKCRQLTANDKTVIVDKGRLWRSSGIYVLLFATIALIVPKPYVEANREYLEELISAEEFTDKLLAAVSIFKDSSTGEEFHSLSDETVFYFVRSDEPLRLKTLTFTEYDYESDSWSVSDNDTNFKYRSEYKPIEAPKAGDLLRAIDLAAEKDREFAEKYGLENFSADNFKSPEIGTIQIYTVGQRAQYAPVPPFAERLIETTYDGSIAVTRSGLVYCADNYFSPNETFKYEYSKSDFLTDDDNKPLIDLMSRSDYYDMLYDASMILEQDNEEQYEILYDHYQQSLNFDDFLNYGGNSKIFDLAQELTSDLDSDYDKAIAIQNYFFINQFVYDLNYRKKPGENAEDFIFTSKRGVCYEYATAMVLLSRAAGIPARYAEGYNMFEQYDNERLHTNYIVKAKSAHGFPELYIRGVGWVSFEPTMVSSIAPVKEEASASVKLSYAGVLMLIVLLLILLAVKLYPKAVHMFFLIRVKRKSGSETVILIMKRICELYKLSPSMTSREAAAEVAEKSGCDINFAAELFDESAYGGYSVTEEEKQKALADYLKAYKANIEHKRRKYRKWRHSS